MSNEASKSLSSLPADLSIPFFAYGALKKDEISWPLIERFDHTSENAIIKGFELALIDGLPTAIEQENAQIFGDVIEFSDSGAAYAAISRFENVPVYYVWGTGQLLDGRQVNLLVSKLPRPTTRFDRATEWDSSKDPYFGYLIPLTFQKLVRLRHLRSRAVPTPEYLFDFLELQMTFTSLWTLTERLYLFREGRRGNEETLYEISRRIGTIGEWRDALANAHITDNMGFLSTRDRFGTDPLRTGELGFPAWYSARNNIVHNGKGAQKEVGSLVRASIDMHNTLAILLQTISPKVARHWDELTSTHPSEHPDWRFFLKQSHH